VSGFSSDTSPKNGTALDPRKITNMRELAVYIDQNSARIYVRDGSRTARLSDLPGDRAVHYAMEFIRQGKLPTVVVEDPEPQGAA